MLQARRRFLADAAHQIRTPLAVLGTQAEYGGRQSDPEEMRRTFASMQGSIRGTRHMVNQWKCAIADSTNSDQVALKLALKRQDPQFRKKYGYT